jgi:hypothetical protein
LAEDAANPTEPLDLSMATATFSDPSSSTLATTTNSNTNNKQQSRKRATEKKENEQQQQIQRKRIKSDEVVGSIWKMDLCKLFAISAGEQFVLSASNNGIHCFKWQWNDSGLKNCWAFGFNSIKNDYIFCFRYR